MCISLQYENITLICTNFFIFVISDDLKSVDKEKKYYLLGYALAKVVCLCYVWKNKMAKILLIFFLPYQIGMVGGYSVLVIQSGTSINAVNKILVEY